MQNSDEAKGISRTVRDAGLNEALTACTQAHAHTCAPDYVFKMTPHIGIITLFRLMTLETIRAITALEMIRTI